MHVRADSLANRTDLTVVINDGTKTVADHVRLDSAEAGGATAVDAAILWTVLENPVFSFGSSGKGRW